MCRRLLAKEVCLRVVCGFVLCVSRCVRVERKSKEKSQLLLVLLDEGEERGERDKTSLRRAPRMAIPTALERHTYSDTTTIPIDIEPSDTLDRHSTARADAFS